MKSYLCILKPPWCKAVHCRDSTNIKAKLSIGWQIMYICHVLRLFLAQCSVLRCASMLKWIPFHCLPDWPTRQICSTYL